MREYQRLAIKCGSLILHLQLCAVSAIVNQERLSAFVFRNYSLPWKIQSHYMGCNDSEIWQAARASAAAPTYFEEYKLGNFLHQVGISENVDIFST